MDINLNIFTNSIQTAPDIRIVRQTYQSFCDTFGEIPTTIYCDSHPNTAKFPEYFKNLKEFFKNCEVIHTNSLSDGYVKSIKNSTTDYLFQLEGDWLFNKPLIKHSLEEITAVMSVGNIYHFRFNKRSNIIVGWDIGLKEIIAPGLIYCETSCLSNNPHIIDVKKYREKCLPLIEIKPGSKGIEENLTHVGLVGCIYGPKDYPATVHHIDGRRSR